MGTKKLTYAEKEVLRQEAYEHHEWLRRVGLEPVPDNVSETTWTGLAMAALWAPTSRDPVLSAIGATGQMTRLAPDVAPIDALLALQQPTGATTFTFIESKGCNTPSNAPGYRSDNNALWQTDRLHALISGYVTCSGCGYEEACAVDGCAVCILGLDEAPRTRLVPPWFSADMRVPGNDFIVLDFAGRKMDAIYQDGVCNQSWRPVGIGTMIARLRGHYETRLQRATASNHAALAAEVAPLVPLLITAYADGRLWR